MAFIKGISYYLPEKVVTNKELLEEFPEWSVDKVAEKVGVYSRHLAAEEETAGDMAEKAARKLFEEYNIDPKSIDFVMLCTQSPDYFLPSTACILQNRLGIPTSASDSVLFLRDSLGISCSILSKMPCSAVPSSCFSSS